MCLLVSIPISNASINPARSIATAIYGGPAAISQLWAFIVAPITGALISSLSYCFAYRKRHAVRQLPTGHAPGPERRKIRDNSTNQRKTKMGNITAVIPKIGVSDLDSAIPFYEELTGTKLGHLFTYGTLALASVGSFLLIEGAANNQPEQPALIIVESLDQVIAQVSLANGQILEGPDDVPKGRRAVIRHPDGSKFEYLQPALTE